MTGSQPNFDAGAGQGGGGRRAPGVERPDVFAHLRVPVPSELVIDVGPHARQVGEDVRLQMAACSNPRVSPNFADNIVILGSGKYGTAIGDILSLAGNDVTMYARDPKVAEDIHQNHRNTRCLGDRALDKSLMASSSRTVAMMDRGIIILAVPTIALEEQINSLKPHPDSIVVNLAKGLIIQGWKPDANRGDYSKGPPRDSKVFLPLEFMRQHPNFEFVKTLCMVAGPGFADELRSGSSLDLSVAASYRDASTGPKGDKEMGRLMAAHVAEKFNRADVTTELTADFTGVQIAAAMKNVISVMVGVCDGLSQAHGEITFAQNLREKIMRFGMLEARNIAKWKGGKTVTFMEPCGYPDLHLSTSSPTGRNYSLGLELAKGSRVDRVILGSGNVVEGALAAWGIKLMTDERPSKDGRPTKPGIYAPVTNALIDIFEGRQSASVVMERLLRDLKKVSMNEIHEWQSEKGRTGLFKAD